MRWIEGGLCEVCFSYYCVSATEDAYCLTGSVLLTCFSSLSFRDVREDEALAAGFDLAIGLVAYDSD